MDFFNPVLSLASEAAAANGEESGPETAGNPSASSSSGGGGWVLGGLVRNFTTKSESVIEGYRRDLVEFGSGLKKETVAIRDAATRAVHSLPVSLESGVSVAQASLESVGQAFDDLGGSVWQGTAEIIAQGKEALLAVDPSDASDLDASSSSAPGRRYSRFEAQVLAIQSDRSTFSEEPEDAEDFKKWRSGFELADKEEDIELLLYDDGNLEEFHEKLVPGEVDYETFWCRYFYRVYKLKQVEDTRAELVKRVISKEEEEEELSWEVDDNEEDLIKEEKKEGSLGENGEVEIVKENKQKGKEVEIKEGAEEEVASKSTDVLQVDKLGSSGAEADNEMPSTAGKSENAESNSEDSDFSVISIQSSMPEEDNIEWDEIEDLGEHDEKKLGGTSSISLPFSVDLRKRLNTAEDDEDLTWDVEEDDEPPKL
ncbi:uncharacterized protein [Typha latifolia]|uniref:uncharacterized protein n=1 Tax=Typha latifolia TaxID=4733 RepID=UPI003C2C2500